MRQAVLTGNETAVVYSVPMGNVLQKVSPLKPKKAKGAPSQFALELGEKLADLLHKRRVSPEELAVTLKGAATASYIRRIQKGEHVPTTEKLQAILKALGSNLGLFFEYQINEEESKAEARQKGHRILERAFNEQEKDAFAIVRILERSL